MDTALILVGALNASLVTKGLQRNKAGRRRGEGQEGRLRDSFTCTLCSSDQTQVFAQGDMACVVTGILGNFRSCNIASLQAMLNILESETKP